MNGCPRGTASPPLVFFSQTFVLVRVMMAKCVTCGAALPPGRARKYNYCMARACQDKNAEGLTMVALGMNKAADELLILDEHTRADLASGKYRDQRRDTSTAAARPPAVRSRALQRIRRQPAPRGRLGRKGSRCCTTSRDCGQLRLRPSSASAPTRQPRSSSPPGTAASPDPRPAPDPGDHCGKSAAAQEAPAGPDPVRNGEASGVSPGLAFPQMAGIRPGLAAGRETRECLRTMPRPGRTASALRSVLR